MFNVEQAEGLKLEKRGEELRPEWEAHREAERVLKANGAEIEHVAGDRAYYRIEEDKIVLPGPGQFSTRNGYYQTALHEAGHATGAFFPDGSRTASKTASIRALDRRSTPARNCGQRSAP